MKALIITILTLTLVVILFFGNIHWDSKKFKSASNPNIVTNNIQEVSSVKLNENKENYLRLATNWPKQAKKQFEEKLDNNKTFYIVLLGSDSIGNNTIGLEPHLSKILTEKYENHVKLESIVYDKTTTDYVSDDEITSLIDRKTDMIIFEPFILNDNNVVSIPDTIMNVETIIQETTEALPDVTFILQPPNQIYDANLYPMQVAALQKYADNQNLPYLNHWKVWPAGNDIAVNDYLKANARPNESGYKLWSNYLSHFLITE